MTDAQIAYIVANKKKKPTFSDFLDYGIVFLPLCLIGASGVLIHSTSDITYLLLAIAFIVLSILFIAKLFVGLKQNISYKSVCTPLSKQGNYQIIVEIFQSDNYQTEQFPNYIVCRTSISFFSWGEILTAIPLDKEILINSHPLLQPITIWKDLQNIDRLEKQINKRVSGSDIG